MSMNLSRLGNMSVNDLRIPTTIEQSSEAETPTGGENRTWSAITSTIWVKDQVIRATYISEGGQLYIVDRHFVSLRYMPSVSVLSGSRYRFNGAFGIWYIKSITDPKNDHHWLVAECTETPP